jgi:hypothetical protein
LGDGGGKRCFVTAITPLSALLVHCCDGEEGTVMARYFAFLVVGCAFTFGAMAMAETHIQVSNPAPQFAAYQSVH